MTTIGVAIPVPEPWATDLQRHRASFGDPLAETIPTHITLVPPTEVADADVVGEHLDRVAQGHGRFHVTLRGTATFRPVSPVVFVVVAKGISSCEMLAASARRGPLAQELRFPYHPHVTIAHDVPDEALDRAFDALADFSCAFEVTSFQLYRHSDDVWRPERSYSLACRTAEIRTTR